MCPGVQVCAAHLLHTWHNCSSPAYIKMGERWEKGGGGEGRHGDLEGL